MAGKPKKYQICNQLLSKQDREDAIFAECRYYSIAKMRGLGTRERQDYRTFPEAMVAAIFNMVEAQETNKQDSSMIYAWTVTGSHIQIPRDLYPHYLQLYNKLTGQNYKMHPLYYVLNLNPLTRG